jgi:hypothetical protein
MHLTCPPGPPRNFWPVGSLIVAEEGAARPATCESADRTIAGRADTPPDSVRAAGR